MRWRPAMGRAVQLIEMMKDTLWARNDITTLCTWLMTLPTALLHANPRQAIRMAQALLANGSLAHVPLLLDAALHAHASLPAAEQTALQGRMLVVCSYLARIAEHFEQAIALAAAALVMLPDSARTSQSLAALGLAMAHHMRGDLPTAATIYRDAIALCEAVDDRFLELTTRCLHGRLLQERGELTAAEAASQQALARATGGTQRLPVAGWALIGLGNVAYMRNDRAATDDFLVSGLDLARRGGVHYAVYDGLRGLVRLRLAAAINIVHQKYVEGIQALDSSSQRQNEPALQQTSAEIQLDFLPLLALHTRQGFYADSIYGGNQNHVGWQLIGFAGPASMAETHAGRYTTRPYFAEQEETEHDAKA